MHAWCLLINALWTKSVWLTMLCSALLCSTHSSPSPMRTQNFSDELEKTSGPVFLPDGQLSNTDLALIPWAYRYYVFEHYRGPDFKIPQTQEMEPYHEWFDHVMNLESVKRTLPDKDRYLEHICKYADGSARSKVANAVRRGVAAHDFDDEKDDY